MASKKQLKNRSWTLMDRKWTPKVVQQGGQERSTNYLFSTFFELWAVLGPKWLPGLPQEPPEPPQASVFIVF